VTPPLRVVLVGFGPVGVRLVEELLPAVAAGDVELTVVGAEECEPYNRILVAEYAAGEAERDALTIADSAELVARGVRVIRGRAALRIDREAREVCVAAPDERAVERIAYDRVVLATGADAIVPSLDGLESVPGGAGGQPTLTDGVCAMRTVADAERAREVIAAGGRVAVLGAGVLGIELALLIADAGAQPRLAHFGPAPMPRQLDRGSARVLVSRLAAAGVDVVPHTRAEAIITREVDGRRVFRALVAGDGKRIEADLLVLSCGVRPRVELAAMAGLRTARGVLVDDRLRSWSDPAIHAIGDVAHLADPVRYAHEREVPGGPSGLVGPGWRQAEWLAAALAAEAAGRRSSSGSSGTAIGDAAPFADDAPGLVMLKSRHVDLVQAGRVVPDPFAPEVPGETAPQVATWADPQHGTYLAMSTIDGALDAFVAVGAPRAASELAVLYQRRGELPSDRSLLLRLDAADQPERAEGREATVCVCNAVTAGDIEDAAGAGCSTIEEIGAATRAGTGCGGCRARIGEMIAQWAGQPA